MHIIICLLYTSTVGAVLYPNGGEEEFKIKRSKIRGVESLGMLCAEDELGIGASHEGIMELPADAKVGQPAREYLKLEDDYVIGIGLTPNRIDAASHILSLIHIFHYPAMEGGNELLVNDQAYYVGRPAGSDEVLIPRDAWEVIKKQADSFKERDEQMNRVISLLEKQMDKGK